MEHTKFKEMIQLALLDELNDEEMKNLHDHLIECGECQSEYDSLNEYYNLLHQKISFEIDDETLSEARRQFHNSFNYELSKQTIIEKSANSLRKLFWLYKGPAFAGTFSLCIGLLLGYIFFGSGSSGINSITGGGNNGANTLITNVQFSNQNAGNGNVEFTFDAVKQVKMKGSLNDPAIQKILAEALINEKNPGVRIETANVLATHISTKSKPDPKVKSALITALKSDANPRVRLEALKALLNYPYDGEINEALLYALQHDNNSGLRVAAINGLAAIKSNGQIDPQTLNVLNDKVKNDNNEYVRIRAASLIKEGQIQ